VLWQGSKLSQLLSVFDRPAPKEGTLHPFLLSSFKGARIRPACLQIVALTNAALTVELKSRRDPFTCQPCAWFENVCDQ
jgi:hypothetical protein